MEVNDGTDISDYIYHYWQRPLKRKRNWQEEYSGKNNKLKGHLKSKHTVEREFFFDVLFLRSKLL